MDGDVTKRTALIPDNAHQICHTYYQLERIKKAKAAALQLAEKQRVTNTQTTPEDSSPVHPFQIVLSQLEQQDWSTLATTIVNHLCISYKAVAFIHQSRSGINNHTAPESIDGHNIRQRIQQFRHYLKGEHLLQQHRRIILQSVSQIDPSQIPAYYNERNILAHNYRRSSNALLLTSVRQLLQRSTINTTMIHATINDVHHLIDIIRDREICWNQAAEEKDNVIISIDQLVTAIVAGLSPSSAIPIHRQQLDEIISSLLTLPLPLCSPNLNIDQMLYKTAFLSPSSSSKTPTDPTRTLEIWLQHMNARITVDSLIHEQQQQHPSDNESVIGRGISSYLSLTNNNNTQWISSPCAPPSLSLSSYFILRYHTEFSQQLAAVASAFQNTTHHLPADHDSDQPYKSAYITNIQNILNYIITMVSGYEKIQPLLNEFILCMEYRHLVCKTIAIYAERMQQRHSSANHGQLKTPILIYSDLLYIIELLKQFIHNIPSDHHTAFSIYLKLVEHSTQQLLTSTHYHSQIWLRSQWDALFNINATMKPKQKQTQSRLIRKDFPQPLPIYRPEQLLSFFTIGEQSPSQATSTPPSPILAMFIDLFIPISVLCRSLHPQCSHTILSMILSMLWDSWIYWLLDISAPMNANAAQQINQEADWMKQHIEADTHMDSETRSALLSLSCWSHLSAVLHIFLHAKSYREASEARKIHKKGKRKSATVAPAPQQEYAGTGPAKKDLIVASNMPLSLIGFALPDYRRFLDLVSTKYTEK